MRKDDVTYHRLGYGYAGAPAVNVKVYEPMKRSDLAAVAAEEGFDPERVLAWWDGLSDDTAEDHDRHAWDAAVAAGWEDLTEEARDIYGPGTRVYAEGRSGGWAYIDGMHAEDVEGWDAIDLARWARFARFARIVADDIPRSMASVIILNAYVADDEEQRRRLNGPSNPALIGATA